MSEFVLVLRERINRVREELETARVTEDDHAIDLHLARLRELLDLAGRHDIDTTSWADPGRQD